MKVMGLTPQPQKKKIRTLGNLKSICGGFIHISSHKRILVVRFSILFSKHGRKQVLPTKLQLTKTKNVRDLGLSKRQPV